MLKVRSVRKQEIAVRSFLFLAIIFYGSALLLLILLIFEVALTFLMVFMELERKG